MCLSLCPRIAVVCHALLERHRNLNHSEYALFLETPLIVGLLTGHRRDEAETRLPLPHRVRQCGHRLYLNMRIGNLYDAFHLPKQGNGICAKAARDSGRYDCHEYFSVLVHVYATIT